MASPSTSTLLSGTLSRFSGAGALEKSSRITRLGAGCWNGANRSPPNQPPLRCCGGPPKLKNCADAGPTIPTSSATATASTISGPVSVNTRKKDFGFVMRIDRNGNQAMVIIAESGRKRADSSHKPAIRRRRQGRCANARFKVTFANGTGVSPPPQPLQHVGGGKSVRRRPDGGLEAAQRLPGLSTELAIGGTLIEAALGQKLLQFQPLGARQHPLLAGPGLYERRAAAQTVGEMADRQRIGFRRVVFHDHPEILQHQEARPLGTGGRQQIGLVGDMREGLTAGARDAEIDRKSTRLNSSHGYISYAVF